ncbi:unnamed protein product, partial [Scytosiphon promiscuus]
YGYRRYYCVIHRSRTGQYGRYRVFSRVILVDTGDSAYSSCSHTGEYGRYRVF